MAKLNFREEQFNGPIPGESMTIEPGKYPFDRPPQTTNAEEAINILFKSMSRPSATNKILDAMDEGVPIDSISNVLVQSMMGEGVIPVQLMPIITPSVLAILVHMAQKAGVKPVVSTEFRTNPAQNISPDDLSRGEKQVVQAVETLESPEEDQGFMQKPEGM